MKLQVIKNRVLYWIKSVVLYTLFTIVLLLVMSFFVLQLPTVQTSLTKKFLGNFSGITGFKSTVEGVQFFWFDRISVDGLAIVDPENNTMIRASNITLNFEFATLLNAGDINIDAVSLDSAQVFLKVIHENDTATDLNINIFIERVREKYQREGTGGGTQRIAIGEAVLENSRFIYDHTGRDSIDDGFDYNHFSLDIKDAQLQSFVAIRDTVEFMVTTMNVTDKKTGLDVKELYTFFRISQKAMEFRGLELQAGRSIISDTIVFHYESQRDLNDFVNKVRIESHFKDTKIYPEDLALFAPATRRINQPMTLTGTATGFVTHFNLQDMQLQFGDTYLQGSLEMDGLPDFVETFIHLNLKRSRIRLTDFSFAMNERSAQRVRPLGVLTLNGEFLGYPTDFVANGEFYSSLGRIITDINFKVNEESFDKSTYKGQLQMIDFDMGRYLNDTVNFQKVSMNGRVSGSGLSSHTANFILNGKVSTIGIKGYDYKNVSTNARFASQFFNGEVVIHDPNLRLNAVGAIDLRDQRNQFNIKATIDTANFYNLKLSTYPLFVQTKLNINFKGLQLDSLSGDAKIDHLFVKYKNETLAVNNLDVKARKTNNNRLLQVTTSLVDAKVEGNFTFTNLFRDIRSRSTEFLLNISNDREALAKYYETKESSNNNYEAEFYFKFRELRPITRLLDIDLDVSPNTEIEGNFLNGKTSRLQVFAQIDTIRYIDNYLYSTEIEVNASKITDSANVLAMAYVNSRRQDIGKNLQTRDLIIEGIWNMDHIDFDISMDQVTRSNYVRLEGEIDFGDSTTIQVSQGSKIQLFDKIWSFHPNNQIATKGKEWAVKNLKIQTAEEYVNLYGALSEDPGKRLTLSIHDFNLQSLNDLTLRALSGTLDAEIHMSDYYRSPNIQNVVNINELKVDDFLIGDITGNNVWDKDHNRFILEFFIDRLDNRIVNCSGSYDPSNKNSLDISAQFDKANLKIFEPFLDDIFTKFEGTLTGLYKITGSLNEPKLNGLGHVDQGQLQVNYLKTVYQFTGSIGLTPTSIYFQNVDLKDAYRNPASLNGRITHRNFRDMQINLDAKLQEFQVLNTTIKDNELFYGQGYATGDVAIDGPLSNLRITSTAKTEKNTRIYIPIGGISSFGDPKDFINFVDFSDSTYQASLNKDQNSKVNLTGITMDFNLEVTPDAYCEIILDAKAGDIIRGRGNGNIKLQLDTKGEFNMFGPIEFTEGAYNFTLYDIINKEFQIQPGSTITWYGDPYEGIMNINATYNQLASLGPIINTNDEKDAAILRRKYPVQVLLELEGQMLSPQINFDILAKDMPSNATLANGTPLTFHFNAFKNRLDEQELKRQVFSLIVLRRFSPPESFNTSGSLVNSVSELFSNQLSYWMSQVDENLEIDVDLGTLDQEAFNTFQLRLSYTFLNGRLRVTRDGTFGNQTATSTNTGRTDLSGVAGDWTVDYLLTPDGMFKVKMYSRTNNNLVNNINNQTAYTTGVSLLHTQSFNELKDLLRSSRHKRQQELEDQENNGEGTKEDNTEGGNE